MKAVIYAQIYFFIKSLSLKKYTAIKYKGTTNQSRDRKNLKDTTGIVPVILVRKIQKRFIEIAIETGCLKILLSIFFPVKSFNKKISNNPANIGSVGIDKSTGAFGINSVSSRENGVKKTETKKTSFKSVKAYHKIRKINGSKIPYQISK